MTKNELIAQFNAENPEIVSTINGEKITLDVLEYEKTRADWVAMRLEQIKLENEIFETAAVKAAAEAKLAGLGLTADDLKALGLGNN
jgi:hypothetical protein